MLALVPYQTSILVLAFNMMIRPISTFLFIETPRRTIGLLGLAKSIARIKSQRCVALTSPLHPPFPLQPGNVRRREEAQDQKCKNQKRLQSGIKICSCNGGRGSSGYASGQTNILQVLQASYDWTLQRKAAFNVQPNCSFEVGGLESSWENVQEESDVGLHQTVEQVGA